MLAEQLSRPDYAFLPPQNRQFILAFDDSMEKFGYTCSDKIFKGLCWGKYMLVYSPAGKSRRTVARIYISEEGNITLRLYFSGITRHADYIRNAPPVVREVFLGPQADCERCHNSTGGICRFQKKYVIDNQEFVKCNGKTFEFKHPEPKDLSAYLDLFREFYPDKTLKQSR